MSSRVSSFQQILMICNELNRAQNNRAYPEEYANCLERALELCDLCSDDDQWDNHRLLELRRARYVIAEIYHTKKQLDTLQLLDVILALDSTSWVMLHSADMHRG